MATFPGMRQSSSYRMGATISGIIGVILYAATGFLYLTSGLVVPAPWLFLLWAVWLVGAYFVGVVFRTARPWSPLLAVAAIAVWGIFLTVGATLFDWTA